MLRRTLFAAPLLFAAPSFQLIAHRGGVVDSSRPENTFFSLSAAIEQQYWMCEVDVRRTRDGEPILHHDSTLAKYYQDPRRPEDLSWSELRALRSTPGNRPPLHFEEACALCGPKMRLMLDLKGNNWPKEFYARLLKHIVAAKIPTPIYSLGGPRVWPLFDGAVTVSINAQELAAQRDEAAMLAQRHFLFDLASTLDEPTLNLARSLHVPAVAAINTFRYTMAKRDEESGPAEDAKKLIALGVTAFQIDSRYRKLFS